MPVGESLKMVRERVTPYFKEEILKSLYHLGKGKSLLFVGHEHIFRGMIQTLTGIDNQAILDLRIPNAAPFVFEFDEHQRPIKNYYVENKDIPVTESTKKESKETQLNLDQVCENF
jgi:2,3-bisphosphoglycerate-dependent phosphoglycerate mutase